MTAGLRFFLPVRVVRRVHSGVIPQSRSIPKHPENDNSGYLEETSCGAKEDDESSYIIYIPLEIPYLY